ncbi:MAG: hypothetical protein IT377_33395 [Polyangiaceae bacterium]|nr:hypothetical protein [Polyangiaceae bacterium]
MSATYSIFSSLAPNEMRELEAAAIAAVEDYLEEHPDCEDDWGEMGAGGALPTADEVRAAHVKLRLTLEPAVLERLDRCRSVLSIDHPGDIETVGGLQVSILSFLLERAGESLVLLNDYPLETGEALSAKLRKRRGAAGFGQAPEPKRRPPARRDAKGGEVRALRVLGLLERAVKDVRVAIDVKQALLAVSPAARNYGALLLEEGALTDAKAAKALGVAQPEVTAAADELERALFRR